MTKSQFHIIQGIDVKNAAAATNAREPMLYRISSVMALLEVSHATVYRMIGRGELELVRISARSSRITSESVARVVATRRRSFDKEYLLDASGTEPSTHELLTVYATVYFVQDLTKNQQ